MRALHILWIMRDLVWYSDCVLKHALGLYNGVQVEKHIVKKIILETSRNLFGRVFKGRLPQALNSFYSPEL